MGGTNAGPVLPFFGTRVGQVSGDVQKAHRRAATGTSLRHSPHFFVVGSVGASPRRRRATIAFTGTTTNTYTAAAISRNEMTALRKSPMSSVLPFTVTVKAEKSGFPAIAP